MRQRKTSFERQLHFESCRIPVFEPTHPALCTVRQRNRHQNFDFRSKHTLSPRPVRHCRISGRTRISLIQIILFSNSILHHDQTTGGLSFEFPLLSPQAYYLHYAAARTTSHTFHIVSHVIFKSIKTIIAGLKLDI
jgi:hypothetical protein